MYDPERSARIERRIRESKKPLNASEQRAELLKRNEQFMRELNCKAEIASPDANGGEPGAEPTGGPG